MWEKKLNFTLISLKIRPKKKVELTPATAMAIVQLGRLDVFPCSLRLLAAEPSVLPVCPIECECHGEREEDNFKVFMSPGHAQ